MSSLNLNQDPECLCVSCNEARVCVQLKMQKEMSLVMTLTVRRLEEHCMRDGLVSTHPETRIGRIPAALGPTRSVLGGFCRPRCSLHSLPPPLSIVLHFSRDQHLHESHRIRDVLQVYALFLSTTKSQFFNFSLTKKLKSKYFFPALFFQLKICISKF